MGQAQPCQRIAGNTLPRLHLRAPEVLPVPACAMPHGATSAEAHPSAQGIWLPPKSVRPTPAEICRVHPYRLAKNLTPGAGAAASSADAAPIRAVGAARAESTINPLITQINIVTCCVSNNGATSASVTIFGSGFGHDPPLRNGGCGASSGFISDDLSLTDTSQSWSLGCLTANFITWNDGYIVLQMAAFYGATDCCHQYWFHSGDNVSISITNPQSGGTGSGSTVVGTPVTIPSEVLPDANRTCNCPTTQVKTGHPFNTRTGNLYNIATDLVVSSPGAALSWTRTYNSQSTGDANAINALGYGWIEPYATHLVTASMAGGEPGVAIVVSPQGNRQRFVDQGSGQFQAYPGIYATLASTGSGSSTTYTETLPDQSTVTFNASGQATAMTDGHGGQLTLQYDGSNRLSQIVDANNAGRYLAIDYTTDGTNHIADVRDPASRTVQYSYTGGDLTQTTDVMGRHVTYHYNTHLLTEVDNNLGQAEEQTTYDVYSPAGKVTAQTEQDGTVLGVDYESDHTTVTTTGGTTTDTSIYQYDPSRNILTGVQRDGVQVELSLATSILSPRSPTATGTPRTSPRTAWGCR